jgi:type IV secretion system protein VirB3
MDNSSHDVYTDPLFVGLTRPALLWGIPYTAAVIEVVTTAIIFLAVGDPFYLLLAVPFHAVLYLISANNPGAFNSIYLWTITTGRCKTFRFWEAASFSPLPTKKWVK